MGAVYDARLDDTEGMQSCQLRFGGGGGFFCKSGWRQPAEICRFCSVSRKVVPVSLPLFTIYRNSEHQERSNNYVRNIQAIMSPILNYKNTD